MRHLEPDLAAAASGDRDALERIFRELQPRLVRFLRAWLSREDADDVAAEVWVALLPRLGSVSGGIDGLRALAFVIARRHVIGEWRRRTRRRTHLVDAADLAGIAGTDDPALAGAEHVDAERAVALIAALLPPDQAEVVLLRVLGDLDTATVASITGRSEGAVRVMLHRALRRLAEALAHRVVTG